MAKDLQPVKDIYTLPLDLGGTKTEKKPTQQEINRRFRDERRLEKAKELKVARSTGVGLGVLARVQKKHPNNPKGQLGMFFSEFVIKSGTGHQRPVSARTNSRYFEGLMGVINDLRSNGSSIQNLGELGKSHCVRLIKYWIAQGQASSTIQNKISVLRRFLTFIGKDQTLPRGGDLKTWLNQQGIEAPDWRQTVASESKAWDQNGVDVSEVLKKLNEYSPITAMQLEMQAAFGLRMREAMELNPRAADHGYTLRVISGTKGGLPREVQFDDDPAMREWQRDVLERAKLFAEQNRKGTLSIQGKSLIQSRDHFYYQVRRVGISTAGLGVTAHGLRHQYAARRYATISGIAAPVHRDAPLVMSEGTRQADLEARTRVSQELGHFRHDVTKAYVGSLPMLEKTRRKRILDWIERTEENTEFQRAMAVAGVRSVWLGGRFAQGLEIDAHEKLRLIVTTDNARPLNPNSRFVLKQALLEMYSRGIDISEHFEEGPPEEALELNLRK